MTSGASWRWPQRAVRGSAGGFYRINSSFTPSEPNTLLDEFLKTDSLPAAPRVLPGDGVTLVIQMLRKLGQGRRRG